MIEIVKGNCPKSVRYYSESIDNSGFVMFFSCKSQFIIEPMKTNRDRKLPISNTSTALEVPVSCRQKNEQKVDASTDFHLNESFFNGFEM